MVEVKALGSSGLTGLHRSWGLGLKGFGVQHGALDLGFIRLRAADVALRAWGFRARVWRGARG